MNIAILQPVVVLIAWSLVMLTWLVIVRLPAMKAAGIDINKVRGGRPGALDAVLEEKAQWPAHNYMHLMEQPTLFYAVVFVIALSGGGHGTSALVAWAYVGLRIVHSLVQATFNRVAIRFALFALSTLALIMLAAYALKIVFKL
jgi:hypothetical protein